MKTDLIEQAHQIDCLSPSTGKVLRSIDCTSDAEVQHSVHRARHAQSAWADMGVRKRIEVLRSFQKLLWADKSRIAGVISAEVGKPAAEALVTEVLVVLDSARFCIENAFSFLRERRVPHANMATKIKAGKIRREPHGVLGIISPWNYPFSIPATESLAALVCGNAVVLKPSEVTPQSALELAALLHRAGVPSDVFQVIRGDGAAGAALLDSPIDKIIFTGSVATGKRVAQAAATRLLPMVLELGGKDPMIVLEDANLDVATSGAVWGAFVNAGQACLSVERCYVHRSVYEVFVEACVRKAKQLSVGHGDEQPADVGPLISEKQLQTVEAHVEDARARGARILAGGQRIPDLGKNYYAPTVLADVTHAMLIMQEETFGPVLPIMSFGTDDEALRLANDSYYGLAASVWTGNRRRGERLASKIQAGTVMINDAVSCFGISEAPHGGVKTSGIGHTHGKFGLEEMVRIKYVDSDRVPFMKKLWWYGYGPAYRELMEGFTDLQFSSSLFSRVQGAGRAVKGFLHRKQL